MERNSDRGYLTREPMKVDILCHHKVLSCMRYRFCLFIMIIRVQKREPRIEPSFHQNDLSIAFKSVHESPRWSMRFHESLIDVTVQTVIVFLWLIVHTVVLFEETDDYIGFEAQ